MYHDHSGTSFDDLNGSVADSGHWHMRVLTIAVAIVVMFGWSTLQAASVRPRPTAVNFNFDKGRKVLLWPGAVLGYVEEQDRFADGTMKRSTVLYAGNHRLKVSLPVEIAEIAGLLAVLLGRPAAPRLEGLPACHLRASHLEEQRAGLARRSR